MENKFATKFHNAGKNVPATVSIYCVASHTWKCRLSTVTNEQLQKLPPKERILIQKHLTMPCIVQIQSEGIDNSKPVLASYSDGLWIRNATKEEQVKSQNSGYTGAIMVDGKTCYVID